MGYFKNSSPIWASVKWSCLLLIRLFNSIETLSLIVTIVKIHWFAKFLDVLWPMGKLIFWKLVQNIKFAIWQYLPYFQKFALLLLLQWTFLVKLSWHIFQTTMFYSGLTTFVFFSLPFILIFLSGNVVLKILRDL